MLGVKILFKSLSQIYYNLSDALKLTGPLFLVMIALNVSVSYFMLGVLSLQDIQGLKNAEELVLTPEYWFTILILILVNVVFSAWISVLWHRYMLLSERPSDLMPPFRSQVIVAYILATLRVFLVLLAAIIPAMVLLAIFAVTGLMSTGVGIVGFGFIFTAYVFYISLRISLVLPSRAIGKAMPIGESWHKTGSTGNAIIVVGILMGTGAYIGQMIGQTVFTNGALLQVFNLVIGWFFVMVSVTILTTLYGYLVEGRSLD